ncbi:hypothetical protein BTA51_04110 [Hahella sp. CCB-MM4]|uniref:VOC family protein n=1 Tax=Hahella sp. (strain CCB-MM4) TaxID=1926491 RepID=UPI000B9BC36A|nr:VOC family protein [Hahella sp. CCB-MM4]OZG74210.1 hypothetical protein BTA51_04110 [Hahella sp. CCB-MM4]
MRLNSYLVFNGNCKEAFTFYAEVFSGTITGSMTFGDMPKDGAGEEGCGNMDMEACKDKIMHICLDTGNDLLMGSDAMPGQYGKPQGLHVAIQVDSTEEAERLYTALSDGGEIIMPIGETFWANRFAMFSDRFGIPWMINYSRAM